MNRLNRVVLIVLLLVVMVLCTIVLVRPVLLLNAVAHQLHALSESIGGLGSRYEPMWFVRVAVCGIFILTLDIIGVLLIVAEIRWPRPKTIRAEKTTGGEVQVSIASIADRLKYEIDQLPGVLRVKAKISAKRGGVVAELDVETAAGIDVPMKAEQIVGTAQQVIEEKLGLKLARPPKVSLFTVPYPRTPAMTGVPKPKEDLTAPPAIQSGSEL